MILTVVAENGKRFKVECNKNEVLKLNGRKCKFLRESCRRVYRCGQYVIKLDGVNGWSYCFQNRDEFKRWLKIKPQDRKYFAKILGMKKGGRGWSVLIQKYVEGRKSKRSDEIERIADRYGIEDIGPHHNFLVRKGRPIIYDLGI